MNKRFLLAVAAIVALLVGAIAFALAPMSSVKVSSTAEHQYVIDTPMKRVRKILVRTNAVKKIVAMANAKLLDQQWLQLEFEVERPILKRDWHVDGTGELNVETTDSYIGNHQITLNQTVDITPDRLFAVNTLDQQTGPIRAYHSTLELVPDDDGKAMIKSSLKLEIETTASWLTRSIVEREIRAAAQKSLTKQEDAIREIVASHEDDLIILPAGGKEK